MSAIYNSPGKTGQQKEPLTDFSQPEKQAECLPDHVLPSAESTAYHPAVG